MKKQTVVLILVSALLLYVSYLQFTAMFAPAGHYFYDLRSRIRTAIWLFGLAGFVQWLVTGRRSSEMLRMWLFYSLFIVMFELTVMGL